MVEPDKLEERLVSMINPYEPPHPPDQSSFWKRFRRAIQLASREYRTGLKRENITLVEHIQSWLILILLCILLLFGVGFLIACVVYFIFQIVTGQELVWKWN